MTSRAQSGKTPSPPRRPRVGAAETQRRMIDAAVARLHEQGLTVGLDGIGMETVIAETGASRATAYRCWPDREAFLADVLTATVRRTTLLPETEADITRLTDLLLAHQDRLTGKQGRRDFVVEALRIAVDADIRRIMASPPWRTFLSLSVTHHTLGQPALRDAVGAALAQTRDSFTRRRASVYAGLAELIGYRLAAPWSGERGYLAMSAATGSMMTGIVTQAMTKDGWLDQREQLQLFGTSTPAPWSEPETMLMGVLLGYLEPDPGVRWTAARIQEARATFDATARTLMSPPTPAT